jgi:hypothetical protein
MANRVEITENVESAIGLNITGASVTVRFRGGAQAPVYDAENGGVLLTQPLATVNGKIGADSPSGAWVAEGEYDFDVVFGGDTLTYAWNSVEPHQFVTNLPAGAGTSAPEDGEMAIELYDSANGGAWLRRWRAVAAAWDMIGGPPPAGGVLPGTPRARQEFYVTGGSPAVQHQRYNGASWEYVGTPPMVPVTGSPKSVLDVGQANQIRAGHQLSLADFSTLLGAPTVPVGLFNLGSIANLGTGGALVNKGTVTFGVGIEGVAAAAAQFTGSVAQALYILDTGAADPFRIRTGSLGAWIKTAKPGTNQRFLTKFDVAGTGYALRVDTTNAAAIGIFIGGAGFAAVGSTNVTDNRWHHVAATHDGTQLMLYVDGVLEATTPAPGLIDVSAKALNVGGYSADAGTNATDPHFGMVDEAFVTADVLSPEQIRLLYAAKIIHGYSVVPRLTALGVRRRRRGAGLVSADFPSQPLRLHSFSAGVLTDQGSNNVALTNNNAAVVVAGADGAKDAAFNFVTATIQSLSATDTGLPAGTATRTFGCWVKTTSLVASGFMGWGSYVAAYELLGVNATTGTLFSNSTGDSITGPFIADGLWHFVVCVEDNAPLDGIKRKLYMDGRLVGTSLVLNSVTLAGANAFRLGATPTAASPFTGQIDEAFIIGVALTPEQIAVLYQKSSQALSQSPKDPMLHVEAFDATNVYAIFDNLDSNTQIDLAVAG